MQFIFRLSNIFKSGVRSLHLQLYFRSDSALYGFLSCEFYIATHVYVHVNNRKAITVKQLAPCSQRFKEEDSNYLMFFKLALQWQVYESLE
jgi:hypothetical protein